MEHGFSLMWRRAKKATGIKGLTFNDLRGTAVVRLAEADCTIPQIASITGHSFKSAAEILERYLPRTRGLAFAAITKLERGKNEHFSRPAPNRACSGALREEKTQ